MSTRTGWDGGSSSPFNAKVYKNHAFVSQQVGIKPASVNSQCSDTQIIILVFSAHIIRFGRILQFRRNVDKYITDICAAFNIKANKHGDESENIHETTGCEGSQAPNTSRTNRHFEGVTSRFLFVHLNFLPLPNLVRLVKVILPYFLPFAELVQCPAGKSTIVMWNSFNVIWIELQFNNKKFRFRKIFNEHGCTQACINKWILYIGALLSLAC